MKDERSKPARFRLTLDAWVDSTPSRAGHWLNLKEYTTQPEQLITLSEFLKFVANEALLELVSAIRWLS